MVEQLHVMILLLVIQEMKVIVHMLMQDITVMALVLMVMKMTVQVLVLLHQL